MQRAAAGENERLRAEHNSRVTAAFYGAVAPHSKKPVKLDDLLIPPTKPKPKRRQTVAEQVAIAKAWTAAIADKPKRRPR